MTIENIHCLKVSIKLKVKSYYDKVRNKQVKKENWEYNFSQGVPSKRITYFDDNENHQIYVEHKVKSIEPVVPSKIVHIFLHVKQNKC